MTEDRKPEPPFPWWYAPASAAITGGAVAIPALGFPLNIATAIGVAAGAGLSAVTGGALAVPALDFPWSLVLASAVAAWYGLYLVHQQRRSELSQGMGKGRRRVVEIAFIVLVLTLMVLALIVSFLNLPRAAALSLIFTGFVVGFFYPSAWNAAG